MSSALWDWMAILTGLRPAGGTFVPLYWTIPARIVPWLEAPPPLPEWVLAFLLACSVLGVAFFLWKHRRHKRVGLYLACAIWGALSADTPYVLLVPPLLVVFWKVPLAIARKRGHRPNRHRHRLRIKRCVLVFLLSLLSAGSANLVRYRSDYPMGYCRRAVAAVRRDGLWWSWNSSRMDELLGVYVKELAREGAGRTWIFTDGCCDSGIELAACGRLRAVSLAGGPLDDEAARRKGFDRREDLFALGSGAARLLRAWAVDRPSELTNAVFQCGFSFFDQIAPNRVESYGLVLRSRGDGVPPSPEEDERAFSAARVLGERILAFRQEGGGEAGVGRTRAIRFAAMQWRVARAIRRGARILDRAGRTAAAHRAVALSERLDELNPHAKNLTEEPEFADHRAFNALSPREGLVFALKRADFSQARQYAKPILADDPGNPEANFALAMGHFQMKEYALARGFFEKALVARPDDPALLNNLAMTLLALGEFESAERSARAALKLKPDSSAIRNTLRQIPIRQRREGR